MTAPRRWVRFSLRTLFLLVTVVGLLAGWVVYQLDWIRQRHETLQRASHLGGPTRAPGLLWLFGEQGYREIDIVFDPNKQTGEARASKQVSDLFPEAEAVSVYGVRSTW